ncbi:MAG: methyltransferase [Deltaproteobacteria bacterium]|nr:methyltransferase [Deltaproteobacteria bacterium]MBZ0219021.1 methyltransferase [Deltaproteobacteria bacterium]
MGIPHISKDETLERLGPYFFVQRKAGQRLTGDSVELAEFAIPALHEDDSIIDIGTGTGAIPLILAWKSRAGKITGVEIDEEAAGTAMKNVESNGLAGRVDIVNRDLRELREAYDEGSFTAVIGNPPYGKTGAGRISPKRERAAARAEVHGGLSDLISISAYLTGRKGRVFYVFPTARLPEMLSELGKAGFRPARMRFLGGKQGRPPKLFLIEAGKEGGMEIEQPL